MSTQLLTDLKSTTPAIVGRNAMNPFGAKDLTALAATSSPVTPTKMIRRPEPAKSEQAPQQAQEDQAGPPGPQAQQSQAGSTGQPTAPGRKPLFRS
jgi:hypothetical protein